MSFSTPTAAPTPTPAATTAGRHAPLILVTGAARRVGAEIARSLHAAGARVALHYRHSAGEADALAAELCARRADSAFTVGGDLARFGVAAEIAAAVLARGDRLDGLVNNASNFYPTPIGAATPQQWDDLFAVNARAPFFLAQAAAPHLRAARGAIVNLTDLYAERPLRQHTVYCMAKAALAMLTRSLAVELAPEVRVNAVAPGAILWPEDEGNTEALALLADCIYQGRGIRRSKTEARKLWKKAAAAGEVQAMIALGDDALASDKELAVALQYYRRAQSAGRGTPDVAYTPQIRLRIAQTETRFVSRRKALAELAEAEQGFRVQLEQAAPDAQLWLDETQKLIEELVAVANQPR